MDDPELIAAIARMNARPPSTLFNPRFKQSVQPPVATTGEAFLHQAKAMASERSITFDAAAEMLAGKLEAAQPAAGRPAKPITGRQFLAEARELAASEGITFDAAAERLDAAYR